MAKVTQESVNVFVQRGIGWYGYNEEQMIGFAMFRFNIFYIEAKKRVREAISLLKTD